MRDDLPLGPAPAIGGIPRGWMSARELDWLEQTATGMESVVEVGAFVGRSTVALARGGAHVWAIDPWDEEFGDAYDEFARNVAGYSNVHPVRRRSPEVAEHFRAVDMVFIDGDHEYESVGADIAAWLPKTRKLLCGHDYGNPACWTGVTRAVDEALEGSIATPAGSIWAVEV